MSKEGLVEVAEIKVEVIEAIVVPLVFLGSQDVADVLHGFGSDFAVDGS